MREISHREIMFEIEMLDREVWRSRLKCLIELITTSGILIFWLFIQVSFIERPSFIIQRILLSIQLLLNAGTWMIWAMPMFYTSLQTRIHVDDSWTEELKDSHIFKRYEMRMHTLVRQKRIERMIDLLIAMQFMLFAMVGTFLFMGLS